nr:unnamed protein product [Callosobruchus analis]
MKFYASILKMPGSAQHTFQRLSKMNL